MKNLYKKVMLSLSVLLLILTFNSSAQTFYNVSGKVYLQDKMPSGPFDSVKVRFISLIDQLPKDSTFSNSDGSYSLKLAPGLYFVEWTKNDYVLEEQKGIQVTADLTLPDKILLPGRVEKVSGNVSGRWGLVNGYYEVTGDIVIPQGQTLIINPGVKVRFRKGTGLICYGTLIADGTAEAGITFTSREVEPAPGDWKSVQLMAGGNLIQYTSYKYAQNGIRGKKAVGTFISFTKISNLSDSDASGLFFENSTNLKFENNEINANRYGIYAPGTQGSAIKNNTISNSDGSFVQPVFMDSCKNCNLDSNQISGGISSNFSESVSISGNKLTRGIYANYSKGMTITQNSLNKSGIEATNGTDNTISYNRIDGTSSAIDIGQSQNTIINYNRIIRTSTSYNTLETAKTMKPNEEIVIYAVASNSTINGNYIEVNFHSINIGAWGIWATDAVIENDTLIIGSPSRREYQIAISLKGTQTKRSVVRNCTIGALGYTMGLEAEYTDIINNKFFSEINNVVMYLSNNVSGNTFENTGILINGGADNIVANNHFASGVIHMNNANAIVKGNVIKQGKAQSGIYADNNSQGEIINNTIISIKDSSSGIHIKNSTFSIRNNIIQGFKNGIFYENPNQNLNIKYNNFWDIKDTVFLGSGMPPLIGQKVDKNSNGDTSDIFKNIFMNPEFIDPEGSDFHLKPSSHMINAGDPSAKDPDGSASDIGAYPAEIYMTIKHEPLKNTSETTKPYLVTAEVMSPSAKQLYVQLLYRLNGADFNALSMTLAQGTAYKAEIPPQPANTKIDYYIKCTDGLFTVTAPSDAPVNLYRFQVISEVKLPPAPFLILPGNEAKDAGLSVKMVWGRSPSAESYRFQLAENSQFSDWKIDEVVPDTSREVKSLKEGVKYFWRVSARNSAGESAFSNAWNFTTILKAPGSLNCSVPGAGKIDLSWNDKSSNETGCIIERKSEESFKVLDTVEQNIIKYTDTSVVPGKKYSYRIKFYTGYAQSAYSNEASATATHVSQAFQLPREYMLFQNYPNPFNPETAIKYALPTESTVRIRIFNVLGKSVQEYYNSSEADGYHVMKFNAGSYSSGIYYYLLEAKSLSGNEEFRSIRKMILLK